MADNLTRHGARTLTESLDRIATAVQHNAAVLGLPGNNAQDFAYRCDLISDAVEKTAASNFPSKEADFDAASIGAEVPGPLVDIATILHRPLTSDTAIGNIVSLART